ncbi:bifunctional 3-(3-hydroxy-phenyl)propionate/3-hydroxycinnamic acid hydroxylase [Streptomyces sp. NPDC046716]|uniref:bifunctional 3-(3-hydroxy-phenyl)propionate/3-hydroxycinnamic acid hydroxylase MhpA n=1 Tax=Streptomyces sp. NPDC046716 TaxID=3157093 RepID=UPI0033E40B4B
MESSLPGRDTSLPEGEDSLPDRDVLVVGAGPVGLALALFLARDGVRTTVVERWPGPYRLPRAVHFDDEIARLLAGAGAGAYAAEGVVAADTYEWRNGSGTPLLRFDWSGTGPSGWPTASMFHQPELEQALEDAARRRPEITLMRGAEAVSVHQDADADSAVLTVRVADGTERRLSAPWLVGCDGANSFVRTALDTTVTDLGFFYDWLIVDVLPHEERTWSPMNIQVCDPDRPTTAVSAGPGRRRWEFMRMPGESREDLDTEATAWKLLSPWGVTPDNATLERHVLYTFQARWCDRWRHGRLLLAGDAAHQMPPFAGQGMCSGIRDAANLAWKLSLVTRGHADSGLLDTYTSERSGHVRHAIGMSVELGKVICVPDPAAAAARDAALLGAECDPARALPPVPPPTLGDGLVHHGPDGTPMGAAGALSPQGRVRHRGVTGLLDQAVGHGFLVCAAEDPRAALDAEDLAFLNAIGAHTIRFTPSHAPEDGEHDAVDIDDFYLPHLAATGHLGAVIRPDHYVYGSFTDTDGLRAVVAALRADLAGATTPTTATTSAGDA